MLRSYTGGPVKFNVICSHLSGGESRQLDNRSGVQGQVLAVMPKAQPLCTGARSNLGDGVLGEVEKNSFIALPGKGGHSGLVPLDTPSLGGFGEEFDSHGSRAGLVIRIRVCAGPALLSSGLR